MAVYDGLKSQAQESKMFYIFHPTRASCGFLTRRQEGHYSEPDSPSAHKLVIWCGGRIADHSLGAADDVASLRKAGYGWAERKNYKISMALPIVN